MLPTILGRLHKCRWNRYIKSVRWLSFTIQPVWITQCANETHYFMPASYCKCLEVMLKQNYFKMFMWHILHRIACLVVSYVHQNYVFCSFFYNRQNYVFFSFICSIMCNWGLENNILIILFTYMIKMIISSNILVLYCCQILQTIQNVIHLLYETIEKLDSLWYCIMNTSLWNRYSFAITG